MRTRFILVAMVVAIALGSLLARAWYARHVEVTPSRPGEYRRIVSLSPSVTEILFALGLGDRVVGVTRFCQYPPEAQSRAKVGGHLDPSFEAIVALKPELVIDREANEATAKRLQELGLNTLVVHHKRLEDILDSLVTIGRTCGVESRARQLRAQIETKLDRVARKTAGLARLRVLLVAERTLGTGRIQDVYAAGSYGFFNRILAMAGGQNACAGVTGEFPVLSAEGILHLNPQVIVDLVPKRADIEHDAAAIAKDWQALSQVEAVRQGRVYVLRDDYAFIPGPRLVLLVEKLARLLHPELEWEP